MIQELLPHYLKFHDSGGKYEILQSFHISGHEVAWMQYSTTIKYDLMGLGREGQPVSDRRIYCDCDFKEGVGWGFGGRNHGVTGFSFKCSFRDEVIRRRQLELRQEYQAKFTNLGEHIPEIILDLMKKAAAGEFMGEDGAGARFWGGYFYTESVVAITGTDDLRASWAKVHDAVDQLVRAQKISMEGAVIQPYLEPPPPAWDENFRLEKDGWVGIASLPAHSKMPQMWKLEILRPDGTAAYPKPKGLRLDYQPDFGPDASDVAAAQACLIKWLDRAMQL